MTMPPSRTSMKTLPRITVTHMAEGPHHAGEGEDGDGQGHVVQAEGRHAQEGQGIGDIADDGLQGLDEDHQDLFRRGGLQVPPGVPGQGAEGEDDQQGRARYRSPALADAQPAPDQGQIEDQIDHAVLAEEGPHQLPITSRL